MCTFGKTVLSNPLLLLLLLLLSLYYSSLYIASLFHQSAARNGQQNVIGLSPTPLVEMVIFRISTDDFRLPCNFVMMVMIIILTLIKVAVLRHL